MDYVAIRLNPITVHSVHSQAFHSKYLFVKWKEKKWKLSRAEKGVRTVSFLKCLLIRYNSTRPLKSFAIRNSWKMMQI